jgi:uncharacterized protein (TIGR03663 family)
MTQKEGSGLLLDRPLFGSKRVTWMTIAYVAIMLFVVFTRLWDLSSRGFSHDESIHAWEAWKLVTGQGYQHNPVYHGPFLYHFTALIYALFGHSDLTARLSTSLIGIAMVAMPLLFRRWVGNKAALLAMLLMAISPVVMTRSRFIRHDQGAVLFNLLLAAVMLRYLESRRKGDLRLVAAAYALGLAAKETSFITYAIFGLFVAAIWLWGVWQSRPNDAEGRFPSLRHSNYSDHASFDLVIVMGTMLLPWASPFAIQALGFDPIDYSANGIISSGIILGVVLAASIAIGLLWNRKLWVECAGIFWGITVVLFTSVFTNGQGLATGVVGSLGYWLSQHGEARGGQPWFYYLVQLGLYEFLPVLLAIVGTVMFALRRDSRPAHVQDQDDGRESFAVAPSRSPSVTLLVFWAWAAFVIYSWAGEKMPWLTLHIAVPAQMLGGWTLAQLADLDWKSIRERGGLWLLLLVPLLLISLVMLAKRQFSLGTTLEELREAMGWLAALIAAGIVGAFVWAIAKRLRSREAWRLVALALVVVLMAATLRFAWMASFVNQDLATEFLFYAMGTPDDALVARELEEMSRRLTGGLYLKVAYDDDTSWPFVWYLRDFENASYFVGSMEGPAEADVVLVGPSNEAAIKPSLGNRYFRRQYRLIWWPDQDWYMQMPDTLWDDLRTPEGRRQLWNVIWRRESEHSLDAWPLVNKFAMYVRRDVAMQLWDYGPEVSVAAEALPGDEYLEKWRPRDAATAWGSSGSEPGLFRAPKGLAMDGQGNVYVADSQNHRIQVFDGSGVLLRQWGQEGSGPGQFLEPWGLDVDAEGNVYVADTWNHRIQVFDAQGNYVRSWGTFGQTGVPGDGELLYGPRDVAVDGDGNVYVSDTGNKRVVKYGPDGVMLFAVGGAGSETGRLEEPVGLAVRSDGTLFVADTWNHRIQAFSADGTFVRSWDVYAWESMSVVNKPFLALDADGHVYATDPEGYRVLVFSDDGTLLDVWGQFGTDLSSMQLPTGIVVDGSGRVLVCDSDNHRILVFAED